VENALNIASMVAQGNVTTSPRGGNQSTLSGDGGSGNGGDDPEKLKRDMQFPLLRK
jgi:hypothetical protein